jgi:hypothetical protein
MLADKRLKLTERPAFLGLFLGLSFGLCDLIWTRLNPLAEDTAAALLAFYGPMFAAWAVTSFVATRRTGRIWEGIKTGTVVAFATFCVLDLMVILRANVFLNELRGRSDWRALMARFQESGFDSLRAYINYHYLSQAPFKILVASAIGACMGVLGGSAGRFTRRIPRGSAA